MEKGGIQGGVVHKLPADLQKAFIADARAVLKWKDVTPLARNEWICWVISAKKQETRDRRIGRAIEDLKQGKRRPCCWAGCVHREG
ncbi:MAG TPA: YdeI/OmpD-associated family protein [Candidatus Paceibacterota bacterium]|nr:YdeI/OmpD-associated family protein [Candidatus Paceibacterota bacterium]